MLQLTCVRVMQGLVREYLTRNSLTGTLKAFDCEKVRSIVIQCDHGLLQLKVKFACSQEAQVQLLQEVHFAKA